MSPEPWEVRLAWSHDRTVNEVWPEVGPRWFPGGQLVPVQGANHPTLRLLDAMAGLDYVISYDDGRTQGLAVRVQRQGPFDSFTLGLGELERRRAARDSGIRPDYVLHAYVTDTGAFSYAVCARMNDLVNYIDEHPTGAWKRVTNRESGDDFIVVWASGVYDDDRTVRRHGTADTKVWVGASWCSIAEAGWLDSSWSCPCGKDSSSRSRWFDANIAASELATWLLLQQRDTGVDVVPHVTLRETTDAFAHLLLRWSTYEPRPPILARAADAARALAPTSTPSLGAAIDYLWMGLWEVVAPGTSVAVPWRCQCGATKVV